MIAGPILGVLYHSIGGFASGSFYIPYRKVKNWAWEVYWLAGGVFSWIIAPAFFAWAVARAAGVDLLPILQEGLREHRTAMIWAYIFGAMWGVGGLTFGLTMRYLGMSLGMAVALGFCAFFGTLVPPLLGMVVGFGWFGGLEQYLPPIYDQNFLDLLKSPSGLVTLAGLGVCLAGIALCGKAGMSKERELPEEDKKATIAEFSYVKGMWVAVFSGIMSACMAFAIKSGDPMGAIAQAKGVSDVFKNTPVLIVVLLGGFTTNFIWCMILCAMNGSFSHFFSGRGASITSNYFFSALAGTTWYLQFFFYSMGTTKMGKYDFASWTLHMATIIIFSNMWGLILQEWKGTSRRTHNLIRLGIIVLIASTVIVGGGTYMKTAEMAATAPAH
ncbi:MAG TPA: L-rhamnose/proton symporter RhaT [Phycisphaerae bacterium]|nr:L-rhamnose/proton symporter RhaT [Phycisphaerae bacterium]HOJ73849.1 L-rhamnose/proton symporter RhaT [Phycisphaerae bacterium]HOM50790.1 L-rhamnose/proton symporter RhaT [Phycisphaerae bacterium]HON68110.1 L-rhamnose/proton symporter RhaT [Phycisphaerae bacterium]HOQ86444.1 L-rhamnose/proton symporter RhaT [Phycisphaerae bacterium]